jgi:hypothetical protein
MVGVQHAEHKPVNESVVAAGRVEARLQENGVG